MPGTTFTPKRARERESDAAGKAGRAVVLADARALPVCRPGGSLSETAALRADDQPRQNGAARGVNHQRAPRNPSRSIQVRGLVEPMIGFALAADSSSRLDWRRGGASIVLRAAQGSKSAKLGAFPGGEQSADATRLARQGGFRRARCSTISPRSVRRRRCLVFSRSSTPLRLNVLKSKSVWRGLISRSTSSKPTTAAPPPPLRLGPCAARRRGVRAIGVLLPAAVRVTSRRASSSSSPSTREYRW